MPMKSKSRTITKRPPSEAAQTPLRVDRLLPRLVPPTHPGEMLLEEFLKPLAISQSAFAIRLGVSFPRLNEIVRGKRSVTPDTALRLAQVTGMSADFWLGLQLDWDLWHALRSDEAKAIAKLRPLPRAS
jgi:antitoxin HigA-1